MKSWHRRAIYMRPAPLLSRLPVVGLSCAAALLLGVALAWADSLRHTDSPIANAGLSDSATSPGAARADRAREGTQLVDQPGYFRMTGSRIALFTADGRQRFVALENLALERIARTIADDPDRLTWSVSGTVTEFRGGNFVLVQRAVVTARERTTERLSAR